MFPILAGVASLMLLGNLVFIYCIYQEKIFLSHRMKVYSLWLLIGSCFWELARLVFFLTDNDWVGLIEELIVQSLILQNIFFQTAILTVFCAHFTFMKPMVLQILKMVAVILYLFIMTISFVKRFTMMEGSWSMIKVLGNLAFPAYALVFESFYNGFVIYATHSLLVQFLSTTNQETRGALHALKYVSVCYLASQYFAVGLYTAYILNRHIDLIYYFSTQWVNIFVYLTLYQNMLIKKITFPIHTNELSKTVKLPS